MATLQVDQTSLTEEDINKLWEAFKVFDEDGSGAVSVAELGKVMRSLGQSPNDIELREMIKEVDVDFSGSIDFNEFKSLMLSQKGDRISRLKLAFTVFDENNSGQITADELRNVMRKFGLTDAELDEIIKEVDHDGDASIDFNEFCQLVPEQTETKIYQDLPSIKVTNTTTTSTTKQIPVTTETAPSVTPITANAEAPVTEINAEIARLKELLSHHPQTEIKRGTSRLQLQIGFFRLIQGAAYRCFRESFSANHETHLRVKNLPYRITDFVQFVTKAIELYKGLEIVEPACHPLLDAVVHSITQAYSQLAERIKNWQAIEKTPEMVAEAEAMLAARNKSTSIKEKFAAGVEFAITMKKKSLNLRDVAEGILALNELNRLRQLELNEEFTPSTPASVGDPQAYLQKWHRVILQDADEQIDGAMMPVAYWYNDFMPKLLAAFSVSTASDIKHNTIADEIALNQWYENAKSQGQFNRYGQDVATGFTKCSPAQKLMMKQAWQLTNYYLNGVQKQRERQEFGRSSGDLSHYVAFIDVPLGLTYVKDSQMRVSFPYYIGPAVWRLFHTLPEILCTKTEAQQTALVAIFKDFFKLFATMYPCPYCRHHLNAYVVQNREVEMYPVEYLVLGRDPRLDSFEVALEAKLSTVKNGDTLRLFFWKLHNTVSSSIARTEEWYHRDEKAFYTTRYWPSLDSELARAKALKHISIGVDRIYRLYGLLKPASQLSGVRKTLQKLLEKNDKEGIKEACLVAEGYIKELEEAVINGGFLQETYYFDPNLQDHAPYFTPEEEQFARSGIFVEV